MYARIGFYHCKPGSGQEIAQKAEQGMLPIFRKHAGFHSYEAIITGGDTVCSISTWENEGQATEAVQAAADWVKGNIADLIVSVENHVGPVAFSHRESQQ
jgi:hypothetical protein